MYEYTSKSRKRFNISDAYNDIAGAAFLFEADGHPNIWIYLIKGKLHFHYAERKLMSKYLVAHYPCHKVTHGFSSFQWNRLGRKLARVHLKNK